MTTTAELELQTVVVAPGGTATMGLTVRNDSDIVEAYEFDVIGECAPWTTVEPARLSLYPGTAETVHVVLSPPRSPSVRAGDVPLAVRVRPEQRPESVVVSETTVRVDAFADLRAELVPRRRRAWRRARYRVELRNAGNALVSVALAADQAEEQLRIGLPTTQVHLGPGDTAPVAVPVRVRALVWFGRPISHPFQLTATPAADQAMDGELVQLPLLPRWLLAILAALLALLIAWFALVRPAVNSAAREATDDRADEIAQAVQEPGAAGQQPGGGPPDEQAGGAQAGGAQGGAQNAAGAAQGGRQSSSTIEVRTGTGQSNTGTYQVPDGTLFRITDILLANHQGDEGVLTIAFGERTITTIALETFRNQDYHWVTPIDISDGAAVTITVTCARPGTPASGQQAATCVQLLNVSGELAELDG